MPGRKIRNAREAHDCLNAAAESGLTRAQWAGLHGIDARSLNAWRLNLERGRSALSPPPLRVVELVPASGPTPVTPLQVRCGPFVVEVTAEVDEELLTRVLALVAAC